MWGYNNDGKICWSNSLCRAQRFCQMDASAEANPTSSYLQSVGTCKAEILDCLADDACFAAVAAGTFDGPMDQNTGDAGYAGSTCESNALCAAYVLCTYPIRGWAYVLGLPPPPAPPGVGQCTGNTDATTDVACTAPKSVKGRCTVDEATALTEAMAGTEAEAEAAFGALPADCAECLVTSWTAAGRQIPGEADFIACADAGAGTTEDDCCETVGQCIGNTDATTDVACTAPKTAIANAGAGTTEDDCCETPAASPQPTDASGSPRTPGGAAVLAAAVGAMTLIA